MKISLAHSPDSDDAFMFYGLAQGKVATGGLEIEHVLQRHREPEPRGRARAATR